MTAMRWIPLLAVLTQGCTMVCVSDVSDLDPAIDLGIPFTNSPPAPWAADPDQPLNIPPIPLYQRSF